MSTVQFCTYLCMYLPQAVSLLPLLGIDWDLFRHDHLADDVQFEPAAVSCSVAVGASLPYDTSANQAAGAA